MTNEPKDTPAIITFSAYMVLLGLVAGGIFLAYAFGRTRGWW